MWRESVWSLFTQILICWLILNNAFTYITTLGYDDYTGKKYRHICILFGTPYSDDDPDMKKWRYFINLDKDHMLQDIWIQIFF